jgi:GNAT superfamily N-acetyltransferase
MTGSLNSIRLRPATPEDESFLVQLYKSSRGDDLRGLGWDEERISQFLEMQYDAQQRFFESEYKRADDQIIVREETRLGRLLVERREHEIRCIDVALLPEYRKAGVGTYLLRQLQAEAKRERKPLRLQIIRFNRAINLLERLEFVRTSETGTHFQMEWVARA